MLKNHSAGRRLTAGGEAGVACDAARGGVGGPRDPPDCHALCIEVVSPLLGWSGAGSRLCLCGAFKKGMRFLLNRQRF